ncbi:MAG TPA: S9 family peptidase [Candidatus Eremiobacteraeota bacterium]|nr:MAG: Prolyl tripeptidyl peptidase precursor [bacterium ADurb.Bin363]HPZ07754.1 S9 family peptidase [Candidatus Eremiobacteraeota bacterium]
MSDKRSLEIEDLFKIKFLDSPFISPDGEKIVFTLKWIDEKKNKYFSNIYMADTESKNIIQFTRGEHSDRRPKWSPDMKYIAFISNRGEKTRIWIIPASGGEAYPITEEDGSFSFFTWSPDSKYIIYSFKKKYKNPDEEDEKETSDKPEKKEPSYFLIDDIQFKSDGQGVTGPDKYHIHIINIETKETKQLTDGNFHDVNPVISPDGKFIAFCTNRSQDIIDDPENDDIFTINLDTMETKQITIERGVKSSINWSPCGKEIVFLGNHTDIGFGWLRNLGVFTVPACGGKDRKLTFDFDFTASNKIVGDLQEFAMGPSSLPQFFDNGKEIAFLATVKGACELYSVTLEGGKPKKILGGKVEIASFHIDKTGKNIALIMGDMMHPHELFHLKKDGNNWVLNKLSNFNEFIQKEIELTEPEDIWFRNSDGVDLHGWIVKPANFNETNKYPLIQQIHGGPHVLYGYTFFHEMYYLASRGYCVLYTNPRGSHGYGEKFAEAIRPHWGTPDTKDQLEFLEYVISKGFIDEKRLYLAGGSYGGYMTVLLISKTDKFRAAIAERSVTNLTTLFGVSDYGYTFKCAVEALPWEEPEKYNLYSPLYNVKNINTPLFIIHSEEDYRAPVDQADQLFTALKFLKKEVKYLRFKKESHGLSRCGSPKNRKIRLKFILNWFESHK